MYTWTWMSHVTVTNESCQTYKWGISPRHHYLRSTGVRTHAHVHIHVDLHTHTNAPSYTQAHTHLHTRIHTYHYDSATHHVLKNMCMHMYVYIHTYTNTNTHAFDVYFACIHFEDKNDTGHTHGVATTSRLLKIVGLFCKRALQKRLYSAKETCNLNEPTNPSHTIVAFYIQMCNAHVYKCMCICVRICKCV